MKLDKQFYFYGLSHSSVLSGIDGGSVNTYFGSKLRSIVLLFFVFLCLSVTADENRLMLDSANAAYSKADYNKAVKLYENIIRNGVEASEIYFNLGNSYYKSNNIAFAILNYERAVKMDPDNEDYIFNLKLANQKIEDKIDTAPQLFLTQWKNSLSGLMTETGWSLLCIVLVVVSLVLFGMYITAQNPILKQIGFFGGTILIVLCVSTFFIARNTFLSAKNSNGAIITSSSITVTGSPNEKGTKLFVLHEGIKVNITQEDSAWVEIKIANGNTGWVKKSHLQKI
ncbi:MAG: tetratricopeptide repeat protein [Bacteroidota bacterium]